MKHLLIIIVLLTMTNNVCGQQVRRSALPTFFQEVIIPYKGLDYAFHRRSADCQHWSNWVQYPTWDRTKSNVSPSFVPRKCNQNIVWSMMGPATMKFLETRPLTSGHYNFTQHKKYDYSTFGGDSYGTYTTRRVMVKVFPPRKK